MVKPEGFCQWCGAPLEDKRKGARFCSRSHSALYSALPERIESASYYAQEYIAKLEGFIEEYPEFTEQARPMFEAIENRLKQAKPRKPYTRKADVTGA